MGVCRCSSGGTRGQHVCHENQDNFHRTDFEGLYTFGKSIYIRITDTKNTLRTSKRCKTTFIVLFLLEEDEF